MSPSPRLVERALSQVDSCERETGSKRDPKTIVEIVLDLFEISDEWQSAPWDDVNGARWDDASPVYKSAPEMMAALGPEAVSNYRRAHHRFVAVTGWERVQARIDWTPE